MRLGASFNINKALLTFTIALVLISCGPKIYKSAEFDAVAAKHKTVAILPADVSIKLRPNESKKMSADQLKDNEEATGYAFQDKLYSWFLRRSEKKNFTVKFQDVNKTNSALKSAGINYEDLALKSKSELAKMLGVDAVISTSVRMDKPMSEGAALAVGIVFGAWGATNNAFTTINIHEAKEGDLIDKNSQWACPWALRKQRK